MFPRIASSSLPFGTHLQSGVEGGSRSSVAAIMVALKRRSPARRHERSFLRCELMRRASATREDEEQRHGRATPRDHRRAAWNPGLGPFYTFACRFAMCPPKSAAGIVMLRPTARNHMGRSAVLNVLTSIAMTPNASALK